jgi:uncharacterized protein (TIGR00369 family)
MTQPARDPGAAQDAIYREDLAALRKVLENSPLHGTLGIQFTSFEPGRASALLPAGGGVANFLGYTHTGALFALAEQVMAAAANSLGYVGLPLNCEMHFLKGADPQRPVTGSARVVDTQGRIARVAVELHQDGDAIARLTEMVFLRSGGRS